MIIKLLIFVAGAIIAWVVLALARISRKEVRIPAFYYKELLPSSQRKAIEQVRDILAEDTWPITDELIDWKAALYRLGFKEPDIRYRLSYSQGDGASFTSKRVDVMNWIKAALYNNKIRKEPKDVLLAHAADHLLHKKVEIDIAEIIRGTTQYLHENTVRLNMSWIFDDRISSADRPVIDKAMNYVEGLIAADIVKLSKEIFKSLQTAHEGATSEEACVDHAENEMIWFDETGKILQR